MSYHKEKHAYAVEFGYLDLLSTCMILSSEAQRKFRAGKISKLSSL